MSNISWDVINWERIARAISFYRERGFEYIEAPWIVEHKYLAITYPKSCAPNHAFQTKFGDIVGSAEQSFLQLAAGGALSYNQKYVACTPCFRDHQPGDKFHKSYFIKVELFAMGTRYSGADFMKVAGEFFHGEGAQISIEETDCGLDWVADNIEIGSYGNRSIAMLDNVGNLVWAYGTGLAEPRFSQAMAVQNSNNRFEKIKTYTEKMDS